ncbi:anthocyanidin-3-O-glucoside rhamnosyltransferase [Ziziphus jujuba]|uniref:Glycosyltransferase n=2 Tax=Ziziphus jujuba TaxID=326968 RepID=A0A6P4A8T0_ZIZJJ|nr:anthocyanidin-3-O-glucoside rhamnosyltransferase [Ziziphus jujuba]KAH7517608.1 hypothetical protein FEM48_Zijuj09G0082900 [Ziziphus jujuba var. spinosa]
MATESAHQLHVVMFPFPAFGHISPFIQLSNKLSFHGVRVSFFSIPDYISRIKTLLIPSPSIQIIPLQLPPDRHQHLNPIQTLDLIQPQIKTLLSNLKPNFVLFDFSQHWLPSLASEIGIKSLFFSMFSGIASAYITVPARLSNLLETPTVSDLKDPPLGFPESSSVRLKTFQAEDYLCMFKSFDGGPTVFNRVLTGWTGCSAIVIKSCEELDGCYLDYLKTQFQKPIFLTGPLVPEPPCGQLEDRWAKWLGQFPPKSVIFCSFGSETFLKDEQIRELSLGLELTGLPFFLVLNFPENVDGKAELERTIPKGFLERVKDRGVVHTGWVQQQLILAHSSVGCYLTHSGFSSLIEALANDCQLVLLPFKGDQFINAKLMSQDLKTGVEVNRKDEDGYFGKEDICEAVKTVMVDVDKEPGRSIRANQEKWNRFLVDNKIQDKFISDLVAELKSFSGQPFSTCTR